MQKTKIPLILISIIIVVIFLYQIYSAMYNQYCYQKCSEFHLLGASNHWNFNDFIIDNEDTIWVDEQCYNDWCICIDECSPGLCCELLK